MQKEIINKFMFDEKVAVEAIKLYLKKTFLKKGYIDSAVIFGLGIVTILLSQYAFGIAFVIIAVLFPFFFKSKANKRVKMESERFKTLYSETNFEHTVVLADDITTAIDGKTNKIDYGRIKAVYENENLILISLKGELYVFMKKDSFTQGSAEDCMKLLKEKIKNNKKR